MFKNYRVLILAIFATALFLSWLAMALTNTKYQQVNYWWQVMLAAFTILGGLLGLAVAKKWSGFKSGVGQGMIFLSLGLVTWGIGQAGWSYYTLKGIEDPTSVLVSTVYIVSIPLWFYGMIQLSRATGAKFGWRSISAKLLTIGMSVVLLVVSYYVLVILARGGLSSYKGDSISDIFYDLGYAFGDVLLLATSLSIFGLSWKYLGGRFKRPVLLILSAFVLQYIADFAFSYYDGKTQYYNGHWCDVVYLAVMAVLAIALCMLNPNVGSRAKNGKKIGESNNTDIPVVPQPSSLPQISGGIS